MNVQFQCYYRYHSGVTTPELSGSSTGQNPGNYVLQYKKPQVTQGVARVTINIVDPN